MRSVKSGRGLSGQVTIRSLALACIATAAMAAGFHSPSLAHARPWLSFSSARALLLPKNGLPHGVRYRYAVSIDSVSTWDGGIGPVMAIDRKNGWWQGAEEYARDVKGRDVMLSAQIFFTASGARNDFTQFFTNAHPETRFIPGAYWLGGAGLKGLGDRATLYHTENDSSHCPGHTTSDLSFVYGNAIFSAEVCATSTGDASVRDLARRLYSRARTKGGHG